MQTEEKTLYLLMETNYITPFWFSRCIEGIQDSVARHKQELRIIGSLDELEDSPKVVVVLGTTKAWLKETIEASRARGMRTILVGSVPSRYGEDVSGTLYGSHSAIERLVYYFYQNKHRHIALIDINANSSNDNVKVESFISTAKKLGLDTSYSDVYYKEGSNANSNRHFLADIKNYDGVIGSNDYSAAFVLKYAEEHGIQVPKDLFVAGLGDTMLCRYTKPSLTSATRSYYECGENTYNIWRTLMKNPAVESIVTTMQSHLKPRGSTDFIPEAPISYTRTAGPSASLSDIEDEALRHGVDSLKLVHECLSQCDAVDMSIIAGVLNNVSNERLAEDLSMATGTINYRLKKLYRNAGVSTKAEFAELIKNSISIDSLLKDSKGNLK